MQQETDVAVLTADRERELITQLRSLRDDIDVELSKVIIGQKDAKRAVAVALRNRWRRAQLPEDMRSEITPKNILMIGPTGVGKTEIARRLAILADAPFIKVEATKFTEVGYVGRDVEQIIHQIQHMTSRFVDISQIVLVSVVADRPEPLLAHQF